MALNITRGDTAKLEDLINKILGSITELKAGHKELRGAMIAQLQEICDLKAAMQQHKLAGEFMNLKFLEHLRHCVKVSFPFEGGGSNMGGAASVSQMGSDVLPGTFPTPDKTLAQEQVFYTLGLDRATREKHFWASVEYSDNRLSSLSGGRCSRHAPNLPVFNCLGNIPAILMMFELSMKGEGDFHKVTTLMNCLDQYSCNLIVPYIDEDNWTYAAVEKAILRKFGGKEQMVTMKANS